MSNSNALQRQRTTPPSSSMEHSGFGRSVGRGDRVQPVPQAHPAPRKSTRPTESGGYTPIADDSEEVGLWRGSEPEPEVLASPPARDKEKRARERWQKGARQVMDALKWKTELFSEDPQSSALRALSVLEEDKGRQLITELTGHTARTKSCHVFDNNRQAISTSDDNTLRVWDLKTGKCKMTLGCDNSELLEHRAPADFPNALGPFGAQETILKPTFDFQNLRFRIPKKQIRVLRERSPLSEQLWDTLLSGDLSAAISKPCRITLPDEAKPAAGIPEAATHFVWAHQLKAAESLSDAQIGQFVNISGEAAFVINGGYVYFRIEGAMADLDHDLWEPTEDGRPILVQANALCICGVVKFQFGACVEVEKPREDAVKRSLDKMIREHRFQKVTITPLRERGARYYCWVLPGEDLSAGGGDPEWKPCEHGGFMYLLNASPKATDPKAEDYERCCYFELSLGHTNWVRGCCLVPDEKQVLSCSADTSLYLWDLETGKSSTKLVGHTNWVWDCCTYIAKSGQLRAISCSSDATVRVWDLKSGIEELCMVEHTDWVMSCCVYRVKGKLRAVSSSKDKTMKSWDLENGSCLHTFEGHEDMVGGCQVYKMDGTNWAERASGVAGEADRALTCSDDRTLRVWDLIENQWLLTLKGHSQIVIACSLFWNEEEQRQYGVSCSTDGEIGVWDLQAGTLERFLQDTDENSRVRGCAAFSDGSKLLSCSGNVVRMWDRDLLGKTDQAVSLTMEHRAELLWKWWPHMTLHEHKAWAQRLWRVMNPPGKEQLTPFDCQTLLYGKDRHGVTLIHRLANEDDGAAVMNYLLSQHTQGRRKAVLGSEGNELMERQAEMTLGLISRAGNSHGQSVLSVAMKGLVSEKDGHRSKEGKQKRIDKAAPMVRLLLDDYCEMVNAVRWDGFTRTRLARYDRFEPLCEDDAVSLFKVFPQDAVSFLQRLRLRPTRGLRPDGFDFIKCDVRDPALSARMLVKSADAMWPTNDISEKQDDVKPMLWWEKMIEDRFYHKAPRWACTSCYNSCRNDERKISKETKTWLVPIVASNTGPQTEFPFSQVLRESCKYAERYASVELFEAKVLQAIICNKWEAGCRDIFLIQFVAYVIYLGFLTYLIVFDHLTELSKCDRDTTSCAAADMCWKICCVFSFLHANYELHQLRMQKKYLSSTWNQLGIASVSITALALALMKGQDAESLTALSPAALRIIHTSALFSRWLKLLLFMRGLDSTAPLMKLLSNIVDEMQSFMVLLVVILACFSVVFCLLLRDTDSDIDEFGTIYDSTLRTYGMVLGSFHTQWFDDAKTGGLATALFVLFTVGVPVVMLNALIAIMSDTYARSKIQEVANGRLMRANLILELESLIGHERADRCLDLRRFVPDSISRTLISRTLQVLMTVRIRGDSQGTYLHVLSFEEPVSGPEQEYGLTSYPFEKDTREGAPAVAIGDASRHESLSASKADVEKLMAQNVQLMSEMSAMRALLSASSKC